MKFLVTGGAGFIGSNIVEELLKRGYEVRVLDNFSTGRRTNISEFNNDIELIEGDIRSYHIVRQAITGIEVVLHQAALPSVPRSIIDPITTNEVNVIGTLNLLEAAKNAGVEKFVFASSSSVYGDSPKLPKHEGMTTRPLSPYAVSKLSGEKYCQVFANLYGIKTIVLRYFNVFGPRQDPSSQYSAVIPKFIKAIKENKKPIIYGDGKQSRDFTYVSNVVEANILAAFKECHTPLLMNCAMHGQVTLNELVNRINDLTGNNIEPIYDKPRLGEIKHSFANIDLIKKELNFLPSVSFLNGIDLTVNYQDN